MKDGEQRSHYQVTPVLHLAFKKELRALSLWLRIFL